MCYRCSTSNPVHNPKAGGRCTNCQQPYVYSFVHFDALPLVEFFLEPDITEEEAIRLIEFASPTSPSLAAKSRAQPPLGSKASTPATAKGKTPAGSRPVTQAAAPTAKPADQSVDDLIAQYSKLTYFPPVCFCTFWSSDASLLSFRCFIGASV